MDTPVKFDLNSAIQKWEKSNFSQKEITPVDRDEIKGHIYELIDELQEKDLTEEEAFSIAKLRFGDRKDWGEEMQTINEDSFQLKKVVMLFTGVIIYFISFNLILSSSRVIFLISNFINGDASGNIESVKIFFYAIYALTASCIVATYFLHQPIKWLLNMKSLGPVKMLYLFLALILIVAIERYLVLHINISLQERPLKSSYENVELYFEYIYLFIVILGSIIIYMRYNKKNNS